MPLKHPGRLSLKRKQISKTIEADIETKILDDLPNVISASGRVSVEYLRALAATFEEVDFVDYLKRPVLVGSAIHEGTLASFPAYGSDSGNRPTLPRKRQKTLMFIPALKMIAEAKTAVESVPLQQALYPLIKSSEAISKNPNVFFIGREPGSDLVVPDFSISRKHALIEIVGEHYFLSDLGSSNGTRINGTADKIQKVELKDGDRVAFARFEFSFLFPASLYLLLQK